MGNMKRLFLLTGFFTISPILVLFLVIFTLFLSYHRDSDTAAAGFFISNKSVAYAALPTNGTLIEAEIISEDGRVEMIRQFLDKYNSPLTPHAELIVTTAEKYGIDHRLIPAIAMQETNLCKKARPGSFNCWGYGVYGKKYYFFDSYEQGIEVVTEMLSRKYKEKGLDTPEEIQTLYTPSSNGSWATGVNQFMDELR